MTSAVKSLVFLVNRMLFAFWGLFRSNISNAGSLKIFRTRLRLQKSAKLSLGKAVTLVNCTIQIGNNSQVILSDACVLKNVNLLVGDDSEMTLDEGVVISYEKDSRDCIQINPGHLKIGPRATLSCGMYLRFNSRLNIGKYTAIGYQSEIVCDQQVDIGEYCLVSNSIDIYDSNSHSVDHTKRRERMESGYPGGTSEVEKPGTAPVSIGNDVWIGKKSIILKGSRIGNRCIVGMGSKVTAQVYPDDTIIVNEKSKAIPKEE